MCPYQELVSDIESSTFQDHMLMLMSFINKSLLGLLHDVHGLQSDLHEVCIDKQGYNHRLNSMKSLL